MISISTNNFQYLLQTRWHHFKIYEQTNISDDYNFKIILKIMK